MDPVKFSHTHEITEDGRVFNFKTGKELKKSKNRDGRSKVEIYLNKDKRKTVSVSRLVAIHFVPNPENKGTVGHDDGDKSNDHYTNLVWQTQAENNLHKFRVLKYPPQKGRSKIVVDLSTGVFFDNGYDAADAYCLKKSTLNSMLNGNRKNRTRLTYV
jgi:hypothetical protein